jgi:adenosylhomocysteine nucleosidase
MSTLICFALKEEAAPFRKIAARKPGVFTLITGIGRQNAERSVREFLLAGSPKMVFTCGFAGGLNPDLKLCDVGFEIENPKSEIENKLVAAGAKPMKFFCADRIASTVVEKRKLRAETGADAVEMESAAIQAVCRERGFPCVTVRVISDTADENLPLDFNALAKPDKGVDFGKLFLAIVKSPGKVGALLELQRKTKSAAEQLAAILEKVATSVSFETE